MRVFIAASLALAAAIEKPLVWMAILILATLRSPFLPQTYGVVPSLWILPQTATIVLAILALRRRLAPEPSTLTV